MRLVIELPTASCGRGSASRYQSRDRRKRLPLWLAAALTATLAMAADRGSWPEILGSIGVSPTGVGIEILEGASPRAEALGIRPTAKRVTIRSVEELRDPKLKIVCEQSVDLPVFDVP